jgi:HJR/Mrr/RecB family endonuclease
MFQADPKRYDLLDRVRDGFSDDWSMNQHRSKVSVGDRIYFRISGKHAGLYATGRVVGPVFETTTPNEFGKWKVSIEYEALIDPPLLKAETLADPLLAPWLPLSGQLATNFIVPDDLAARLDEVVMGRLKATAKPVGTTFDHALHELGQALDQHRAKVKSELLTYLKSLKPGDFELVVLLLLEKVGYDDVRHEGKTGDGGVDIRATLRLPGVTAVPTAVQVKRWSNTVAPGVVQQLRGALMADEHGMVVTTSHFSPAAIAEASAVGKRPIALIDGHALVDLLVDHDLGVTSKAVRLIALDPAGLLEAIGSGEVDD